MLWSFRYGIPPLGSASVHEIVVLKISQDPERFERWRLRLSCSAAQGLLLFEPRDSRLCHHAALVSIKLLFSKYLRIPSKHGTDMKSDMGK